MRRQDLWRAQYHEDPYLDHLDLGAVEQRFIDALANETYVSDELNIGWRTFKDGGEYWLPTSTHVMEELARRGRGLPDHGETRVAPHYDWPGLAAAVGPFRQARYSGRPVLVRFGSLVHMRELVELGRVLLNPASTYNDPSFNRAVADDELQLSVYRKSRLFTRLYDRYGYVLSPTGPRNGRIRETLRSHTNYYVYCTSLCANLRLFGDFGVDAAVIIHEPVKLVRRLAEAAVKHLGPTWSWFATPVKYIDPLRPPSGGLNIVQCKDFRFTYQMEHRIVWLPSSTETTLAPFFVEIGSVADIATLVALPTGGAAQVQVRSATLDG